MALLAILRNANFWYALIMMAIATVVLALGVTMMPTNFMLGIVLEIVGVIMAGMSTVLFVITGVQVAGVRKARKLSGDYI
jgi:hypothetical protein